MLGFQGHVTASKKYPSGDDLEELKTFFTLLRSGKEAKQFKILFKILNIFKD